MKNNTNIPTPRPAIAPVMDRESGYTWIYFDISINLADTGAALFISHVTTVFESYAIRGISHILWFISFSHVGWVTRYHIMSRMRIQSKVLKITKKEQSMNQAVAFYLISIVYLICTGSREEEMPCQTRRLSKQDVISPSHRSSTMSDNSHVDLEAVKSFKDFPAKRCPHGYKIHPTSCTH